VTPRYKLRTLLLLLAILPPLLAGGWWKYSAWKAEQDRRRAEVAAAQQQIRLANQMLLRVGKLTAAQRTQIALQKAQLAAKIAALEEDALRPKAPAKAGE